MKTKKIVLIISFLFFSLLVNSQNKTTRDLLMANTWVMSFPTPKEYVYCSSYSLTECSGSFITRGRDKKEESFKDKIYYYLTDKYETTFNDKMVGQNKNGKYIMTKSNKGEVSCYEILKLDSKELIFQYINVKTSKKGYTSRFTPGRCIVPTR